MSHVYEAIDSTIDRTVALKVLDIPSSIGEDGERFIHRFKREARAAGILSHPNIVTIYEVGEASGEHYIAMELLHGTTVRKLLQFSGPFPPEKVIEIALQVCEALIAAHEQGIIHQDIKPDNIMIRGDGLVKIADFGIARAITDGGITQTGAVKGSPAYMSPEQVQSMPVDPRTDIFSLGVTLYEMLTGIRPFEADSITASIYRTLNEEPDLSGVPETLRPIIGRALQKQPDKRFFSAHEMKAQLQSLASNLSVPSDTRTAVIQPLPGKGQIVAPRRGLPDVVYLFLIPFCVLLGACATFLAMQMGPAPLASHANRLRVTTLDLDGDGSRWRVSRDRSLEMASSLRLEPEGGIRNRWMRLEGLKLNGVSQAWLALDVPRTNLRYYGDSVAVNLYLPPRAPRGIRARLSLQGQGWKPKEYLSPPTALAPGKRTTLSWKADDEMTHVGRLLLSLYTEGESYEGYIGVSEARITGMVQ
ncbi:MAG: serine/threonine protein kinase [Armatimonadetes bacterium]|nr:serine/threonine protein kinase [Armatimonadota bacterium]